MNHPQHTPAHMQPLPLPQPIKPDRPYGLLFVCLGNICRSPLAEGVFIHLARERNLIDRVRVDSCGTGNWHAGKRADPRSLAVAERAGVHLPSRARQFDPHHDTASFDLMLAMDLANRRDLIDAGADPARVRLMRSFDPALAGLDDNIEHNVDNDHKSLDVPDPYYGGDDGFDHVHSMLVAACNGLVAQVTQMVR